MKKYVLVIAISFWFIGTASATSVEFSDFSSDAITIDFDITPDGTSIVGIPVPPYTGNISNLNSVVDDEYSTLGVIFSSNDSGAIAVEDSTTQIAGISSPNSLIGTTNSTTYSTGGPIFVEFKDPISGLPGSTTQVGAFSIDVDLAPASFTVFDFRGNELETVFFSVGGNGSIDFAGIRRDEGISSVAINAAGTDFFAIDNLIYEPITAVPLPSAAILFGSVFISWAGVFVKRRIN